MRVCVNMYTKLLFGAITLLLCAACNAQEQAYLYSPPFQKGKSFLVVQGFNGDYSHNTPIAQYAVDLALPEGEPVCAARAGTVIDLYDGQEITKSHFVYIQHEDGSIGDYEHLLLSSVQVTLDQEIKEGQCFAKTGSTGNSSGPHLHFAVLTRKGLLSLTLVSKPFYFNSQNGAVVPNYLTWIDNVFQR